MPAPFAAAATAALIRQLMLRGLTRREATKVISQTKTPRQLQQVGVKEGIAKAGREAGKAYESLKNMGKGKGSGLVENKKVTNKSAGAAVAAGLASAASSTGGKKSSTEEPSDNYSLPSVDVPSQITMSKGGAVKKMESGGEVRASRKSARKGIDGCAVRGKTRAVRNV
jgi:hypothetical protein